MTALQHTEWWLQPHLHRVLGSERLVLAVNSSTRPLRLNSEAAAVLAAFAGGSTIAGLVEATDPQSDRLRHDIETVVASFVNHKLLGPRPLARPEWPDAPTLVAPPADVEPWTNADIPRLWSILSRFGTHPSLDEQGADVSRLGLACEQQMVETIERGGGLGLIGQAIAAGWVVLSADAKDLVHERWAANQMHCLSVEQQLVRVVESLTGAGFDHRVLKGVAVAHLDYKDPSWREFGDADVLLQDDQYDAALNHLLEDEELRLRRHRGDVETAFQEVKGSPLVSENQLIVDLHRRLHIGAFGARAPHELFECAEHFGLAGTTLSAPRKAARFVHAAAHLALGRWTRRGTLADFAVLADADPTDIARIARPLRLQAAVGRALSTPDVEEIGIPTAATIVGALDPTTLERVLVSSSDDWVYSTDLLRCELGGLLLTPGVRSRFTYLQRRLFPSKAHRLARNIHWSRSIRRRMRRWQTARRGALL